MNLRSKELTIKGATKRASSMRRFRTTKVTMPRRGSRLGGVWGGYKPHI